MRRIDTAGISLATKTFGKEGDPAWLLIMGATAFMKGRPDEFCTALAARGFRVIRIDHRDTGQSTTVPPGEADHAVEDMAGDAISILDACAVDRAHGIGMWLGGYIARMRLILRPERVATLTLIGPEPPGWDAAPLPHVPAEFPGHFGRLGLIDGSDRDAVMELLLATQRLCAGSTAAQPGDDQQIADDPRRGNLHVALAHCADLATRIGEPCANRDEVGKADNQHRTGLYRLKPRHRRPR